MNFWINLKRLVRIFHRLTLLEQPDKPRLRPDAIGSGFWCYREDADPNEPNVMPDSGPLDKFFERGGISIKDVLDSDDNGNDPSAA